MEIQVATIEIEGKIMSAGFHSKVDEARKELEEAQKAYNEIDEEYAT